MQAVQRRRDALAAALAPAPRGRPWTDARSRRDLEARLADWRTTLRRNVPQGRQLLRKLLVGRVTFTPVAEGVRFDAECALGPILQGVADATTGVTPAGFEPAISTLKGSRPWPG